jgi:toxin ParE1/3/4
MKFKVVLDKRALHDLTDAVEYYNTQQKGLGKFFLKEVNQCFELLAKNPFYQVRYDDVRCLPFSKFPFMVHFRVIEENKTVKVSAVIHTSLNPKTKWLK